MGRDKSLEISAASSRMCDLTLKDEIKPSNEAMKKEIETILERERWQARTSGKIEGATTVLYALDLDMNKRIGLLADAVGLSYTTAKGIIEPEEIKYRIHKSTYLTGEEQEALINLLLNDAMQDNTVLNHPEMTLRFISAVGGEKFIEEAIPVATKWVENGETVTMHRVRDWLLDKYVFGNTGNQPA